MQQKMRNIVLINLKTVLFECIFGIFHIKILLHLICGASNRYNLNIKAFYYKLFSFMFRVRVSIFVTRKAWIEYPDNYIIISDHSETVTLTSMPESLALKMYEHFS